VCQTVASNTGSPPPVASLCLGEADRSCCSSLENFLCAFLGGLVWWRTQHCGGSSLSVHKAYGFDSSCITPHSPMSIPPIHTSQCQHLLFTHMCICMHACKHPLAHEYVHTRAHARTHTFPPSRLVVVTTPFHLSITGNAPIHVHAPGAASCTGTQPMCTSCAHALPTYAHLTHP